ncbi:hypothetical protein C8F04DRAFT_1393452 [Mycena alexandri]|uniref:BTB domain-containing protein n=1 Tax=Mycena alexandri TaxID=1745969 RepID=A0AAD6T1S4_9AGAR|nr:hypothetical protein C8F04DRAFT_1393452 [Mycena alexandri]
MHSSVFRDMFTMPLPPDEPTIENSPVDTLQNWLLFLEVLYPKWKKHRRLHSSPPCCA